MAATAYVMLVICVGLCDVIMHHTDATSAADPGVAREYCRDEKFSPRCYNSDEVVVVTQADYGLPARGRCFDTDYSDVGCFADVISHVAGMCSGRRSCDLGIPNPALDNMTHCSRDFPFFLNATFTCVKVERRTCSSCPSNGHARVTSSERGLLASIVTAETQTDVGCGSTTCPWLIEVRPGQVINLTLFDYGPSHIDRSRIISSLSYPSSSAESQCTGPRYAVIKERANPRETLVCGANKNGKRHVYTSISNHLEVHVISREVLEWSAQFIVEYEAVGCADVTPPRNTWMKRSDNKVEVGCPTTGAKWVLTCVDGKWSGEIGKTCPGVPGVSIPGDVQPVSVSGRPTTSSSFLADFPMNVLIAAVVAVACIIGVLILTLGIVCIKRHQYKKRHPASRPSSIYARATSEFEFLGELRSGGGGGPETAPMMAMSSRQRPPTATKPRLSMGRQYPDGLIGYDTEQQHLAAVAARHAIGSRPLPSIPGGSTDRRGAVPLQTTVQLHPTTGSMQSACTCHSHPRGPAYCYPAAGLPSLAPKVRSIGTGPAADGGWGPPIDSQSALYGNTILPYTDDQHHYFVLDPEVVQDPATAAAATGPVLLPPPSPATTLQQHNNLVSTTATTAVNTMESDPGLRFPTPPPPLPEVELTTKSTGVARRQSPDGKEREEDKDMSANEELNKNRCSVHEIPLRPSRDGQSSQGKGVTTAVMGGGSEGIDMGTSSWP